MSNYKKNSTKLLPLIENYQNNTVFYTEYDSRFDVGDILYIMVIDNTKLDYNLDSFNNSSIIEKRKYKLLQKDNNKLTLDINYEELTSLGITELNNDICFISKIYIKNASVYRGTINNSMFHKIKLSPNSNFNINWKQSIVYTTENIIKNINFDKKQENYEILKSDYVDGIINNYFVYEPNDISMINLSNITVELLNCNISNGIFNNIELTGYRHVINGGIIKNSIIGPNHIIDDGYFIDTTLYDMTIEWNYGKWNNSHTGSTNSPFNPLVWNDGIWENGHFPSTTTWYNGRFINGTFEGQYWYNGIFGYTDINRNDEDTVCTAEFINTIWDNGIFNGGKMKYSTWNDGDFNNGLIEDTDWNGGDFNNGIIKTKDSPTNKNWNGGNFYNGLIYKMDYNDGNFYGGKIQDSTWNDGNFYGGEVINSTWNDGNFYGGKMQDSTWNDGNFYNGSLFNSDWNYGVLYFGTMSNVIWSGGTWLNGIANNVDFYDGEWYDGIFNYGHFYKGNWYDGSFNSGFFGDVSLNAIWNNGNFYFGIFNGVWVNGTFYTGEDNYGIPPSDVIGSPYKQYNEQNVTYTYEEERLPSKKNY